MAEALAPEQLRRAVEENLRDLGVDVVDVVHLRMPGSSEPVERSLAEPFEALAAMQAEALETVARRLEASPMQVALAWVLARSPNVLIIPGTSPVAHLEDNLAAATLELSAEDLRELDEARQDQAA